MTPSKKEKVSKTQEELLHERTKMGKLPVIDIVGHPFFVDTRMEYFRPHDDFSTPGISFSFFDHFEYYADPVIIAYDPKRHVAVEDIDFDKLTEIPKDWVMVKIPHPITLDPYGYARDYELDIQKALQKFPLRENVKARIVPWEKTGILQDIERNRQRLQDKRKRLKSNRITSDDKNSKNTLGKLR